MSLKNNQGYSLIESIIVTAIFATNALLFAQMNESQNRANRGVKLSADFINVKNALQLFLGDTLNCTSSLGLGQKFDPARPEGSPITISVPRTSQTFLKEGMKDADSITYQEVRLKPLDPPDPGVNLGGGKTRYLANLRVAGRKPAGGYVGSPHLTSDQWISVTIDDTTKSILDCGMKGDSASDNTQSTFAAQVLIPKNNGLEMGWDARAGADFEWVTNPSVPASHIRAGLWNVQLFAEVVPARCNNCGLAPTTAAVYSPTVNGVSAPKYYAQADDEHEWASTRHPVFYYQVRVDDSGSFANAFKILMKANHPPDALSVGVMTLSIQANRVSD